MLIPFLIVSVAATICLAIMYYYLIQSQANEEVLTQQIQDLENALEEARDENEMWRDNPPKVYDNRTSSRNNKVTSQS